MQYTGETTRGPRVTVARREIRAWLEASPEGQRIETLVTRLLDA